MWSIRGLVGLIILVACVFPAFLFLALYDLAGRPPYPSESALSGLLRGTVANLIGYTGIMLTPYAYLAIGQAWFPLLSAHSNLQRLATRNAGEVTDATTRVPAVITLEPRVAPPFLVDKDPWDDIGMLTITNEGISFRGGFITMDAPREAVQAVRVGHGVESIFSADGCIMLILRAQDGPIGVQLSAIGWRTSRSLIKQQYELVAALEQELSLTAMPLG